MHLFLHSLFNNINIVDVRVPVKKLKPYYCFTLNLHIIKMNISISKCCRVCLGKNCHLNSISIPDEDNIKLSEKLKSCVSEICWLKEGFTQLICSRCVDKLRIAYDFRRLCLESENTLQIHQNKPKYSIAPQFSDDPLKLEPCVSEILPANLQYRVLDIPKLESLDEILPFSNMIVQRSLQYDCSDISITNHDTNEMQNSVFLKRDTTANVTGNCVNRLEVTQTQPLSESLIPTTLSEIKIEPTQIKEEIFIGNPFKFSCKICGKEYARNTNLKIHMTTHTGENPYECKYCQKKFSHSSQLRHHIRRHTGEKRFLCTLCSKDFMWKAHLTEHMRSHTGEKPYVCTYCDKKFMKASNMQVHLRSHTGEKPYRCTYCDKRFARGDSFNSHLRRHTGDKYFCKVCNRKFVYPSQVTYHMRQHTDKQLDQCTVCKRVFKSFSELQQHLMMHVRKKFACSSCDKKFTRATYLRDHVKTHTGEDLFRCSDCNKSFPRAVYLERHIKTHNSEKPFMCKTCNKRFKQSSSLKAHLGRHTDL